jgi:hypothetical protein
VITVGAGDAVGVRGASGLVIAVGIGDAVAVVVEVSVSVTTELEATVGVGVALPVCACGSLKLRADLASDWTTGECAERDVAKATVTVDARSRNTANPVAARHQSKPL